MTLKPFVFAALLPLNAMAFSDAQIDRANKYSDDYGTELREATRAAVEGGVCQLSEIAEDGWTRSTRYAKTYFTYCGYGTGWPTEAHRVYITLGKNQFWNDRCHDIDRKVTTRSGQKLTYTFSSCQAYRK